MKGPYTSEQCAAFAAHWFGLRHDGGIPTLAAFLDKPVPKFQPRVAIVEVIADDDIRYRLVGTGLVESFGEERTGHNLLDVSDPSFRTNLVRWSRTIQNHPCGARSLGLGGSSKGRELTFETVSFPLQRKTGAPFIVGYSEPLSRLDPDEALVTYKNAKDVIWIDIGNGVPDAHA